MRASTSLAVRRSRGIKTLQRALEAEFEAVICLTPFMSSQEGCFTRPQRTHVAATFAFAVPRGLALGA